MKHPIYNDRTIDMRVILLLLVGFWLVAACLIGCDRDGWPQPIRVDHGVNVQADEAPGPIGL